jgi:hypothetical protein
VRGCGGGEEVWMWEYWKGGARVKRTAGSKGEGNVGRVRRGWSLTRRCMASESSGSPQGIVPPRALKFAR